jgi:hypothetical protein
MIKAATMILGKTPAFCLLTLGAAFSLACGRSPNEEAQREHDANTVAGKAGKVAYGVAKETGKAAKVVGHKMAEAAHDAHEGWKAASAEDKDKK